MSGSVWVWGLSWPASETHISSSSSIINVLWWPLAAHRDSEGTLQIYALLRWAESPLFRFMACDELPLLVSMVKFRHWNNMLALLEQFNWFSVWSEAGEWDSSVNSTKKTSLPQISSPHFLLQPYTPCWILECTLPNPLNTTGEVSLPTEM